MSTTDMLTSNSLAVKLWAKQGWVQMMARTFVGHAFNRGAIHFAEDLMGQRARGDEITYDYTGKLTANPIGEGGTVDGNEEALDLGNYSMAMNVTRHAVLNPNEDTIEQQRTNVAFEGRAREILPRRFSEYLDTSFFYQAAGADPTSFTLNGTTYATAAQKLHVQGHNTPTAPSSDRIIRAASAASDQAITSSDKMKLDYINYMVELNDNSDQPIERFDDGTFDLVMSPSQLTDLELDSAGKVQWLNYQFAKITGGQGNEFESQWKNGMILVGRYKDVNLYSSPRVAYGVSGADSSVITTVRRAVLLGKNALSFASPFGGRMKDSTPPIKFFTQLKDYEYYKGIEARLIYGLKKTVPSNGSDIGVMVLSTYAASHT